MLEQELQKIRESIFHDLAPREDVDHIFNEIERHKMIEIRLKKSLKKLADAHNGFSKGMGPCRCQAHKDAFALLEELYGDARKN